MRVLSIALILLAIHTSLPASAESYADKLISLLVQKIGEHPNLAEIPDGAGPDAMSQCSVDYLNGTAGQVGGSTLSDAQLKAFGRALDLMAAGNWGDLEPYCSDKDLTVLKKYLP